MLKWQESASSTIDFNILESVTVMSMKFKLAYANVAQKDLSKGTVKYDIKGGQGGR